MKKIKVPMVKPAKKTKSKKTKIKRAGTMVRTAKVSQTKNEI